MGAPAPGRAVGREPAAVGADHGERVGQDPLEVLLAHRESQHADPALTPAQQGDGGLVRLGADRPGVAAEAPAFRGPVLRGADRGDLHVLPPADQLHLGERLGADARRDRRIVQPCEEPPGPAVPAPDREQVGEPRRVRDVRIAVEGRVEPVAPGALDAGERVVEPAPVARALGLEMGDLQRASGAGCHRDGLVDRVEQAVVLVPHMGGIGEPARAERRAQRDQLLPGGKGARGVFEPGGRAAGAVGEGPRHHRGHLLQLGRRGGAVAVADHRPPDGAKSDHRCHIHAGLDPVDGREHRREGPPLPLLRAARAGPAVLSRHYRGDALADRRFGPRILVQGAVGVGVHVDEARRDREAARVYLLGAAAGDARGDRLDATGAHGDVPLDSRRAEPVEDVAAADHEIVVRPAQVDGRRPGDGRERRAAPHQERPTGIGVHRRLTHAGAPG